MKFIAQTEVPEAGPTTVLAYPSQIYSDLQNMSHVLIGTSVGNLYFYDLHQKRLSNHRLGRQTILKKDCPISSIEFNPRKPHRVLLCYYQKALHVYSINKHESIRALEGKPFAAAKFIESGKDL